MSRAQERRAEERRAEAANITPSEKDTPELYTTLEGNGSDQFEEKRSVFIGHAAPVKTEEEAMAFIRSKQKAYADATHNVWAYRLGNETAARYSDDGEPQGSSGLPTLEAIRKSGVTDAVVVITRYFGGTLLGIGGLVRAYAHTARLALDAAHIITYEKYTELSVEVSYADYQKLLPELPRFGVLTDDQDFSDRVFLLLALRQTAADGFVRRVCELTAGRCVPEVLGTRFDYR